MKQTIFTIVIQSLEQLINLHNLDVKMFIVQVLISGKYIIAKNALTTINMLIYISIIHNNNDNA